MFLSASVVVVFFFGGKGVGEYPISSILDTHLSSLLSRYLKFNRVGIIDWWNILKRGMPCVKQGSHKNGIAKKL